MMTKAWLMQYLSNAKQVYTAARAVTLDFATTGEGKGGYPADIGVKSGLEYVRYLVQTKVFKEGDLKVFCLAGKGVYSIAELKADNIAFRFANVSSQDPPDTIFIVSRNLIEGMPAPKKWWDFSAENPFAKGYVIIRLNGDGAFYTAKSPPDLKTLGGLPPREPKFLEP